MQEMSECNRNNLQLEMHFILDDITKHSRVRTRQPRTLTAPRFPTLFSRGRRPFSLASQLPSASPRCPGRLSIPWHTFHAVSRSILLLPEFLEARRMKEQGLSLWNVSSACMGWGKFEDATYQRKGKGIFQALAQERQVMINASLLMQVIRPLRQGEIPADSAQQTI